MANWPDARLHRLRASPMVEYVAATARAHGYLDPGAIRRSLRRPRRPGRPWRPPECPDGQSAMSHVDGSPTTMPRGGKGVITYHTMVWEFLYNVQMKLGKTSERLERWNLFDQDCGTGDTLPATSVRCRPLSTNDAVGGATASRRRRTRSTSPHPDS